MRISILWGLLEIEYDYVYLEEEEDMLPKQGFEPLYMEVNPYTQRRVSMAWHSNGNGVQAKWIDVRCDCFDNEHAHPSVWKRLGSNYADFVTAQACMSKPEVVRKW